jgi:hypothetical protein
VRVREQGVDILYGSRVNHRGNFGVPAPWSLGDSPASFRPFSLVWSGVDDHVQGMRRPLLHGKLRSEDDIKVIRARGGEHCLCGKVLTYLA